MLEGKPNKKWAERLDALELPAGSSFDKTAAWQKLQQRLTGKKRNRGFAWLIMSAAAAILLVVFLFTFKKNQREMTPVRATNTWPILVIDHSQSTPSSPPVAVVPTGNKRKSTTQVPLIDVIKDSIAGNTVIAFSNPDTAGTAMPVAKKKKMSVVHNNELEPSAFTLPQKKSTASTAALLAEYRKHQDLIIELTDTLNEIKPRKKLLPFSSLISQKQ